MISFPSRKLWFAHVLILVVSNFAVQIPVAIGPIDSTWGTFTYPFLFLTTDLTVRVFGEARAKRIVFHALLPGLLLSYIVGVLFEHGVFRGFGALAVFSIFVARIALASLVAYGLGQLADILVFSRLRRMDAWWCAPAAGSVFGNLLDTFVFYAVAFFGCDDAFMASHWVGLAWVDYAVKILANLAVLLPLYGVFLRYLLKRFSA